MIVPGILDAETLAQIRALIDGAQWVDGRITAGSQSALAKHNTQLSEDAPEAREAGKIVLDALGQSSLFFAAGLPFRVYPPLFNRYGPGDEFGVHVDNAIRIRRGSDFRLRSDLSATLFLSEPDSYEGGELTVEGQPGVKLSAGDMILYPASTMHRVEPVRSGTRVAAFFWIQSMVRSDADRSVLFDLDRAIQSLSVTRGQGDQDIVRLTGVYHNLLRRWAEL
ncbi:Fe2+-dependent dioxygenase [soil metagenome]